MHVLALNAHHYFFGNVNDIYSVLASSLEYMAFKQIYSYVLRSNIHI